MYLLIQCGKTSLASELPHKQFLFELLKETLKWINSIETCKFCGVSCVLPFPHSFHSVCGSLSF